MSNKCDVFSLFHLVEKFKLPIKFEYYDPNPLSNQHTGFFKQINTCPGHGDCSTRVLTKLFDAPYDPVFNRQLSLAKKYNYPSDNWLITNKIFRDRGYKYKSCIDTTVFGFVLLHLKGKYALEILNGTHLISLVDGTLYDSFVCKYKCKDKCQCDNKCDDYTSYLNYILESDVSGYYYDNN